jgi:hypothetical protein
MSAFAQRSDRPARGVAIGWMLLGLLATVPAMAGPQVPIDLRWEAPPGCPQESDVRERIQKLLGSSRHDNQLRAEGTITKMDRRFRLELVVHVRELVGTRSIESSSCEDLAGAAAVEMGLLVHSAEAVAIPIPNEGVPATSSSAGGPGTSASRSDGTRGSSPPGTNSASPIKRPVDSVKADGNAEAQGEAKEETPPVESQRPWRVLFQAPLVALGVGPLPAPALGGGLALGFAYAPWQLQLQGLSWRRQNVAATAFPGYGADVDRIAAAMWACREFRLVPFGFSSCLTAGMDRVSASGTGRSIVASQQHALGANAGVGAQGRLYLASWLRLLVAVKGEIVLVRPQISIAGLGPLDPNPQAEPPAPPTPVYRFAPAAFSATLGLEWAL